MDSAEQQYNICWRSIVKENLCQARESDKVIPLVTHEKSCNHHVSGR
jgi:hypothetical protein